MPNPSNNLSEYIIYIFYMEGWFDIQNLDFDIQNQNLSNIF